MRINKLGSTLTLAAFVLILTACEPTDAEINKAVSDQVNNANNLAEQMVGKKVAELAQVKLVSVKKISCKEASGVPGYNCDVSITLDSKFGGQASNTGTIRLIKGDNGWQVAEDKK